MGLFPGTSEIVEMKEELKCIQNYGASKQLNFKYRGQGKADKKILLAPEQVHMMNQELRKLFEAIDLMGSSLKNSTKRSMKVVKSHTSSMEISEPVTLKQALRGQCISQASEMASMKRLSRQVRSSVFSKKGNIRQPCSAVVNQSTESGISVKADQEDIIEISLISEETNLHIFEKETEFIQTANILSAPSNKNVVSWPNADEEMMSNHRNFDIVYPVPTIPFMGVTEVKQNRRLNSSKACSSYHTENIYSSKAVNHSKVFTKKIKHEINFASRNMTAKNEINSIGSGLCKGKSGSQAFKSTYNGAGKELVSFSPRTGVPDAEISLQPDTSSEKVQSCSKYCHQDEILLAEMCECLRFIEKGECSQSSKSSTGEYRTSTSISGESNISGTICNGHRPHTSNDLRWDAIQHSKSQYGSLGLRNFHLLKKLGSGDIGTVYLAALKGTKCYFAIKVMDNEFLASRTKQVRAETERKILQMLDHPFLPTLYTYFTTDSFSCLVMDYCPGGDLHVLRQRQPGRSFSESAARFYAAEVLLALEYLHMLGIVYRDLKPENILVREDGHIMLSDFDLSFQSEVNPVLLKSSSTKLESSRNCGSRPTSSCIEPLCLQPSWVPISCFTTRLKPSIHKQLQSLPQLVAEPTEARSNSFVGTHEYLAPEIIMGEGHGNAVDWWTFGIFLYELLFGKTPFKGLGNDETLSNVVAKSLKFPEDQCPNFAARDLIEKLLVKDPEYRLGSIRGAAEIKDHPFFAGLNWALVRCMVPPEISTPPEKLGMIASETSFPKFQNEELNSLEFTSFGEQLEFELF